MATVAGTGSMWNNSGILYVGNQGTGTLNVNTGGSVSNTTGYIGYNVAGLSAATVTGGGSKWANSSSLYVGYTNGGTGTLNVSNGGYVSNTSGYIGDGTVNASGTVTVTGAGSKWVNSSVLYMAYGSSGDNATLNITSGGYVSNTVGELGYNGVGNATVDGTGSQWVNSGILYVGQSANGTLNVTNGGYVSNTTGYVSYSSTFPPTSSVTVGGTSSTWTNSAALDVAYGSKTTGTVNVTGGASVTNVAATIGYGGTSTAP